MGVLRLYLALAVLQTHSAPDTSRYIPHGVVAVICFFIVSGFYIAMVVTEKYKDDIPRFYLNRALRLYPTYIVVLCAAFVAHYFGVLGIEHVGSFWQNIGQLTIFPRILWDTLTLTPGQKEDAIYQFTIGPIYTVGIEMLFYLLAPLFVRRHILVLIAIFIVAMAMHATPYWLRLPPREWQYEFFPGVFVFFVAGVLSYRIYQVIRDIPNAGVIGYLSAPVLVAYVYNLKQTPPSYVNEWSPYGLYVGVALMIPFLFLATHRMKFDKFIGDLSYPLYVVHAPIIAVIAASSPDLTSWIGKGLSIAAASPLATIIGFPDDNWIARGLSIAAAIGLSLTIEGPLEKVRNYVRSHATLPIFKIHDAPIFRRFGRRS